MPFTLSSPYTWLLGALAALALFGAGFYVGDSHIAKINATAQAQAVSQARSDQAAADMKQAAQDRAQAVADSAARARMDQVASDAAAKLTASLPVLLAGPIRTVTVPINGICPEPTIPAGVLHGLNDPQLIGAP